MSAGWPATIDLLESVIAFLDQEARPGLSDPALVFKLRIAVNVLRIVQRDVREGPAADSRALAALRGFMDTEDGDLESLNRQLCEDIRSGRSDTREDVLIALLEQLTLDRLAIDNPRFDTFRMLRPDETSA